MLPVKRHSAESKTQISALDSFAGDKECRLSGNLLAEILLSNRHVKKDLFWKSLKTSINDSISDTQFAESILRRFWAPATSWLSNYVMRKYKLNRTCAWLLMEFVGYYKGCRDCGRFNDLPACRFCSSELCNEHMLPCHFCLSFGDDVFGGVGRTCCSNCACSWCHRGVCEEHMLTCECGNHICFNYGCGGCESCPAYCSANHAVSLYEHGFYCKDYKRYLRSCPMCRPKLPPPDECGLCGQKIQCYGSQCKEGVESCQLCNVLICPECSSKCGECKERICDSCVGSDQVIRCSLCSHWGVFCGKCRSSCHCPQESLKPKAVRKKKKKKKKIRYSKKTSKKKRPVKRRAVRKIWRKQYKKKQKHK